MRLALGRALAPWLGCWTRSLRYVHRRAFPSRNLRRAARALFELLRRAPAAYFHQAVNAAAAPVQDRPSSRAATAYEGSNIRCRRFSRRPAESTASASVVRSGAPAAGPPDACVRSVRAAQSRLREIPMTASLRSCPSPEKAQRRTPNVPNRRLGRCPKLPSRPSPPRHNRQPASSPSSSNPPSNLSTRPHSMAVPGVSIMPSAMANTVQA